MMIGVLEKDNSFDLNVPEEPTEEEEQKELKEEKEEVKVRQVPILMEDGRRVVHKKTVKNGDSSIPNLSADFQRDIEDFVQKRDGDGRRTCSSMAKSGTLSKQPGLSIRRLEG